MFQKSNCAQSVTYWILQADGDKNNKLSVPGCRILTFSESLWHELTYATQSCQQLSYLCATDHFLSATLKKSLRKSRGRYINCGSVVRLLLLCVFALSFGSVLVIGLTSFYVQVLPVSEDSETERKLSPCAAFPNTPKQLHQPVFLQFPQ